MLMTEESFLRGAFILALSSGISRVLGIVYIIFIPRIILDEGMGLIQLVKPIHYFAVVIAILGMPTAVSILVAEKAAQGSIPGVFRVLRVSFLILVATGLGACGAMWASASFFSGHVIKDPGVYLIILVMAPSAFFYALGGAFRGFFQGLQHMTPTAVSQVLDQIVRVVLTITLAIWLMPHGVELAVAGTAMAVVAGEFVSVLTLFTFFMVQKQSLVAKIARRSRPDYEPGRKLCKRLLRLALPIVLTTVLWPIMQMLDTVLIPERMQAAGFDQAQIRELMGYLGMALTLSQLPNIITVAMSTSLIPAISEAATLGSKRLVAKRTREAIRIALIFGLPSFAALFVLAEPISQLLFSYPQVGAPLRILAIGTITLGTIQATTGVLEGMSLVMIPVKNLLVGVGVKFVCNYLLTGIPGVGITGAAWGTTLGWLVVAFLNVYSVCQQVDLRINVKEVLLKPVGAALITALSLHYLFDTLHVLGPNTATLLTVTWSMSLYFLLLMMMGAIHEKDVRLLPKVGTPLADWLYTWGFLRK